MNQDQSFGVIPVKKENNEIKFLIVKHKDGHWGFPKGHLKDGENELECAGRELIEETGATNICLNPEIKFEERYICEKREGQCDKTVTYFLGFIENLSDRTKEFQQEIPEVALLNYEQARTTLTHSEAKEILDKAYNIVKKPRKRPKNN